jgi:glycosyltransferase involved in cell wall biosynthesis
MKGHVEAMEIFRRSRLENSTLLIIGNDYGRGCGKKCAVLGLINSYDPRMLVTKNRVIIEDIDRLRTVAAYFEADVFLFPSQYECSPLVLYECLASGTPFISTDVGNAREIAESTGAGMIMPSTVDDQKRAHPDIDRSAKILRELIMDKDKIDKMGKKGRKAWTEMYTWSKISHQFESMYQEIIDGR